MTIRPFRMYSTQDSAAIVSGLEDTVNAWYDKWFTRLSCHLEFRNVGGREDVLLPRLHAAMGAAGDSVGICSDGVVILVSQPDLAASNMLGSPGSAGAATAGAWSEVPDPLSAFDHKLMRQILEDCLASLGTSLSAACTKKPNFIGLEELAGGDGIEGRFLRGKGAGVLTIACNEFCIEVVLDADLLAVYVEPLRVKTIGGLAPVMPLITDKRVALRAELGVSRLTIGDLDRMSVGDVVRLDQTIDTDPQLLTESGVPIVKGRLGSKGKQKALQIY